MERYQGVKIDCRRQDQTFDGFEPDLHRLHHWTYLFSQLGLAPVHAEGAYGNQSFRCEGESFIISRSGMLPEKAFSRDDFCHVVSCDARDNSCCFSGRSLPSSETLLHYLLYRQHPWLGAILHGHCSLLLEHAEALAIPTTKAAHPYGTVELAHSAVELVDASTRVFNLKNHGFVALGRDIDEAGRITLQTYSRLISLLLEKP